jgi:hypothetical protein
MFLCATVREMSTSRAYNRPRNWDFAAVALTTAVKVKVIFIFICYHNYNISICIFPV